MVGNDERWPDPLKMPYRVMLLEEGSTNGPVIQDYAETLVGAAHALGFSEGFDAGDSNPHVDTHWIEAYDADTGKYEEVALELLKP